MGQQPAAAARHGPGAIVARGSSAFKQRDVTRAVRATVAAGVGVKRVEIEAGKITIVTGPPEAVQVSGNSWDDVLAHEDR
jgi:hypothetical protein